MNPSATNSSGEETITIDLKNQNLAALLAWLVPGLGHFYQGRIGKGVLFSVCILGTFAYGFYLGEGRVVYAASHDAETHFPWYAIQAGVGLPAMPAIVQWNAPAGARQNLFGGYYAPPRFHRLGAGGQRPLWQDPDDPNGTLYEHELAKWKLEIDGFELGMTYTMIAGLLNVLAIYDAWGGPVIVVPRKKRRPGESDEDAEKT